MSSILSFPILCLVSFSAWALRSGFMDGYMLDPSYRSRMTHLREEKRVGVNGDDVIFKCLDRGAAWNEGVSGIGGRTSRGKTLVSSRVFTVNSELWVVQDGKFHAPDTVRPSLLLCIADGRTLNPNVLYEQYINCPILDRDEALDVRVFEKLKAHLPRSMGGIGQVFRFDCFDVLRAVIRRELKDRISRVFPRGKPVSVTLKRCIIPRKDASLHQEQVRNAQGMKGEPSWSESVNEREVNSLARKQWKYLTQNEVNVFYHLYKYEMELEKKDLKVALILDSAKTNVRPRVFRFLGAGGELREGCLDDWESGLGGECGGALD